MAERSKKRPDCAIAHCAEGGFAKPEKVRTQAEIAVELKDIERTADELVTVTYPDLNYAESVGIYRTTVAWLSESLARELEGDCPYCATPGGMTRLRKRRNSEASHG